LPTFYTISTVRNDIDRYQKNDSYSNCCSDLCSFFKDKSIEEIFDQPQILYQGIGFRYIKSRLDNSNNAKGKSNGYRLYYYVDKTKGTITILGFYPKTGRFGKPGLTKQEEKNMIEEYKASYRSGTLMEHEIGEAFSLVEQ